MAVNYLYSVVKVTNQIIFEKERKPGDSDCSSEGEGWRWGWGETESQEERMHKSGPSPSNQGFLSRACALKDSFHSHTHKINAFYEVGSIINVQKDTSVNRTNSSSFRCLVRRGIQTNIQYDVIKS